MLVKVEFTVATEDFGKEEFKKEIITLLEDIDPYTILRTFDMYKI